MFACVHTLPKCKCSGGLRGVSPCVSLSKVDRVLLLGRTTMRSGLWHIAKEDSFLSLCVCCGSIVTTVFGSH